MVPLPAGRESPKTASAPRRGTHNGPLRWTVLVLLAAQILALLPPPPGPLASWDPPAQLAARGHTARATGRTTGCSASLLCLQQGLRLQIRLRGGADGDEAGTEMEEGDDKDAGVGAVAELDSEKLFEALASCRDKAALLGRAFAEGNDEIREQAVGYLLLLLEEEGFLENLSARALLRAARDSPALVRDAISRLQLSPSGELAPPLRRVLSVLPAAIERVSLGEGDSDEGSAVAQGKWPAGALQAAVETILSSDALVGLLAQLPCWSGKPAAATVLGALASFSPLDEQVGVAAAGDPLKVRHPRPPPPRRCSPRVRPAARWLCCALGVPGAA